MLNRRKFLQNFALAGAATALPIGIQARFDADKGQISLLEGAVVDS